MEIDISWKVLHSLIIISVVMLGRCGESSWEALDLIIEKNETCVKQQEKFALAAQQFTYCSIVSARPITFCESCVNSYLEVLKSHEEILAGHDDGANCKEKLINVDRLEIIETFFTNLVQLWNKGECDYCFEINPNGTVTSTLNNDTNTFQQMDLSVRQCIKQNMQNKSSICILCLKPYKKLNDFYNSLKNSKESGKVCMDIVDSMNASRMEWSEDLGCKYYSGTDLKLILSASFVSIIPIIFYGLVKKYSSKTESRLLHQSRLAEQLVSPSTSGFS